MRQKLILTLALLAGAFPTMLSGQNHPEVATSDLARGRIIDTVWCRDDPEQSYALYLPQSYHPSRQWPIMYVFEPAARGRLPLEHLRLSSETHGVILVASNNSRNGSWSESFKAAQAVFDDTWRRFEIDTGRVYSCGFSGGARVATALALNSGRIAGVLACGAGFPTVPEYQPQPNMPFAWVGVVGNRDMNFLEVHKTQEKITGWNGRAHALDFDGRHAWPAEDTLLLAMDLLTLEAIRKGKTASDAQKGQEMVDRLRKRATDYAGMGRKFEAGTWLLALHQAFPAHFGNEDKARADNWLSDKESQKEEKEHAKTLKREDELQRKYSEEFILDLNQPDDSACVRFWKEESALLHKMQASKSQEKARMADRLVNQLWVRCYEMGQRAKEREDYRSWATYNQIWACVQPNSVIAHYQAARGYARLGKKKFSLEHLGKAIDNGLKDKKRLEVEDFDDLRETKAFRKLAGRLSGEDAGGPD